jgi:predicted O-linked N-acetylglucosamine transferase (SPINDLY family)
MSQLDIEHAFQVARQLHQSGQVREAVAIYQQILTQQPEHAGALHYMGVVAQQTGHNDIALNLIRKAIALQPQYPEAHNNLGSLHRDMGQLDEAIAAFAAALKLKPDYPVAHSNLIFTMHFHPGCDASSIGRELARWNHQHAEPLRRLIQPHLNDRDPDRRLRIGYVSPDFREHPVGRFLLPLLANHDKSQFEVFAYAQVFRSDATTERLRSHVDGWRGIVGLSDDQAADLIRQDQIDILVDLAMHTANNRLLVFARKPAPIQVSYLGYPDSTGLRAIDYRLSDVHADPPGTGDSSTEQLVRLPRTFLCYRPADAAPPVGPVPARAAGRITFGSFNAPAKVNAPLVAMWSQVLNQIPDSRLILKSPGLQSDGAREHMSRYFPANLVETGRVELVGWTPTEAEHLRFYERIDIALDTFPYHGTATTCEALWMGVPIITLAGDAHMSRVGVSILRNIGLAELIADSPAQFVQIACRLASDTPRLGELRSTLRQRMRQSPLMDAPGFARDIESAYRRMWHTWCAAPAGNA